MEGTLEMGDQMNLSTNAQLPQEQQVGLHVDLADSEERETLSSMDTAELHAECSTAVSALASPVTPHCIKHEDGKLSSPPSFPHGLGEGRVPLWIKWRGKWQAGIQCSLEDCPAQTVKAMPTYGRKSYIVVFFPNSRSFVWTDWQLVCPISEDPEPLSFGTHESGRISVADLNGARQYMLRKLASALLDISDRLPVQAVVDCARHVSFWKDFAKDAAKAATYRELGVLLVKLKNMILPTFIKESWGPNYIEDWKHQCESVETAGSMEKLAKELKGAVVWDEVSKLWDEVEQTKLDSEWKTWKEDANCNDSNEPNSSVTGHRRPCATSEWPLEGSYGHARSIDAGFEDSCKRLKVEEHESMSSLPDSMEGSVVQRGIGKNAYILSLSAVANNTRSWGSRLSEGAAVDLAACSDDQRKGKLPLMDAGGDDSNGLVCVGMTKFGRRCTHKARDGSTFCLKHMSKMIDMGNSTAASIGNVEFQVDTPEQHSVINNRKRKLEMATAGASSQASSKASKLASKIAARIANGMRCAGWSRKSGSQCSHRAKLGFLFCEKHLPNSHNSARKGQGRTLAKAVSAATLDMESRCISRLKELVNEYIVVRLGDDGAQSSQHSISWQKLIDSILSEVDGNLRDSEALHELISSEMERLKSVFEKEALEDQRNSVPLVNKPVEQGSCSIPAAGGEQSLQHLSNVELLKQVSLKSTGHIPRFRCKLCAQEFVELHVLGQHWRACHKKEAQQYFRGYACQHCSLPFTNKKGLYRHRNTHHPGMSSQNKSSLIALCVICSGQFMNFEDLWQHVIRSHPDQLCAFWPVTPAVGSASDPWKPPGLEVVDFTNCVDCEKKFATCAELQQHRETSHKDYDLSSHMESLRRISDTADELKYKCKVCGLRFRLLPDLGRHHQAEHKPAQIMRLMNVKEDPFLSGPLEELNSIMGGEKARKKLQKLNVRRPPGGQLKTEVPLIAQQNFGPCDQSVSDIQGQAGPKLEGFPNNRDILAVAKSVCCKNKLYDVLQEKYVSLPNQLALKAAKLCNEANVRLEFFREGYVCPNGCKDVCSASVDSKLVPDLSLTYANCFSSLSQFNHSVGDNGALLKSNNIILDKCHAVFTAVPSVKQNVNDTIVLCEDLSFGKERIPIPCVVDRDVMRLESGTVCIEKSEALMPWIHFSYVTKRTLDPSLGLDTESSRLGCSCQGSECSPAQCEHVYIFDNDNADAQDMYGQPMVGRFPYDSQGCIIMEEGYPVYECNSICSCQETCQNRVLQKGVQVKLEVYKTRHKGWAVRAAQRIARGTFVCEYIGEVLDDFEANKRGERYDKEGCSYLYNIDAHIDIRRRGRSKPFVIDATKFGNVARFINHSCSPNLVNYQVLVESMDCQLAHIGLYATRNITIGEELAYDYRYKLLPGKGCPCHCGASDCRGRLY